jgi:hypothetical protein
LQRTPQLDGQAVSIIVTFSAHDLENSDGLVGDPIGAMAGSAFPVSRKNVERFIDGGGYRTVTLAKNGSVTGISSLQRCFTHTQRMAIGGRDGFRCGTPGCVSPHYSLQVHHVIPARDGEPTSVEIRRLGNRICAAAGCENKNSMSRGAVCRQHRPCTPTRGVP